MRYAVLVCGWYHDNTRKLRLAKPVPVSLGPAGSGKSTFCSSMLTNLQHQHRTCHLVNLDPAADSASFEYEPSIDIRDLISLEDVMGELGYGPNGGLVYCFE